eukprot:gene12136-biopygen3026
MHAGGFAAPPPPPTPRGTRSGRHARATPAPRPRHPPETPAAVRQYGIRQYGIRLPYCTTVRHTTAVLYDSTAYDWCGVRQYGVRERHVPRTTVRHTARTAYDSTAYGNTSAHIPATGEGIY